jgi:hypothetical protein
MTQQPSIPGEIRQKPVGELVEDITAASRQALETGARVAAEVTELENRTKAALDWRTQYNRHPWVLLGLTMLAATVMFSLSPRRS